MSYRFYLIVVILGLVVHSINAQQLGQYSLWGYDTYSLHPAAAGNRDAIVGALLVRNQWQGLAGAPLQQQVSLNAPIWSINSGIGLVIGNESIGQEQNTNIAVSYAYKIPITSTKLVSFGVEGSYQQKRLRGDRLLTPDGKYEPGVLIDHKDQKLSSISEGANVLNSAVGINFRSDKIDFSITAKNILPRKWTFSNGMNQFYIQKATYYSSIVWQLLKNNNFVLWSTGLLRYQEGVIQCEISIASTFGDKFDFGLGLRGYDKKSLDALMLFGCYKLNDNYKLLFCYDLGLSQLMKTNRGTIEFGLLANWGQQKMKRKLPPLEYNLRY